MLDILIPFIGLAVALYTLIKGADVFIEGAKQVGSALGMSSFVIGVFIVGIGTSLPEFASSIAAVLEGNTDIVIANVVGSNITNILLVVGISALVGGTIIIKQDLLRSELPVFFIATVHFVFSLLNGVIDRVEAALLIGTFVAYIWYLIKESNEDEDTEIKARPKIDTKSIARIIFGLVALLIGAKYSVEMIVSIGESLHVPLSLISITVLAIGTSLPELFVSVRAIMQKEHELGIGNIFGSNSFNLLFVGGASGIIAPLSADNLIMDIGLPVLIAASLIFFIAGLAKRVTKWEGAMMLLFFIFFLVKLITYI